MSLIKDVIKSREKISPENALEVNSRLGVISLGRHEFQRSITTEKPYLFASMIQEPVGEEVPVQPQLVEATPERLSELSVARARQALEAIYDQPV